MTLNSKKNKTQAVTLRTHWFIWCVLQIVLAVGVQKKQYPLAFCLRKWDKELILYLSFFQV